MMAREHEAGTILYLHTHDISTITMCHVHRVAVQWNWI